jgi:colanic acid/amylovoran biosynthesis protein
MNIEIHGAGFENKGAELMLRTVIDELNRRLPSSELCIDPAYGPYKNRADLKLFQVLPLRRHVGVTGFPLRFLRQKLLSGRSFSAFFKLITGGRLSTFGCTQISDIDAFIDISGFAYTDWWGAGPTRNLARVTGYYKSRGRPVILLPQGLGPFSSPAIRSSFQQVMKNADLIFARDSESYKHAVDLVTDASKIFQAPDITFFYPSNKVDHRSVSSAYVTLIPNVRMTDQGKGDWGDHYLSTLVAIGHFLTKMGIPLEILVHDSTGEDLQLAQTLHQQLGSDTVRIVTEEDPLRLKNYIGRSRLVIGSRYHSLIAALSMGVPVVALGWANKYDQLLEDFGLEDMLVTPRTPVEKVFGQIAQLCYETINTHLSGQILQHVEDIRSRNSHMWEMVIQVLGR